MQVFGSSKIFKRGLSVNSSFDISYISSSLDLSKTLSLRRLTQAELCSQSSHGTKCAKNSTFNGYDIYFDEVSPIPGKGIQLRSTTPIYIYMAPGRV